MPLFGRTEHLAAAERALEDARAGRGSVLVMTGEAGIGKSALARTLATEAEARGARVGFGRAWEVGGAPAYWPWSQALGELGLDLDELLGSASSEMASAQRLVAFDRVVRAVCPTDGSPVVLILDDVHAADIATLELALAFARTALRKRALLVVTTRESELLERRELGELVGKLAREGNTIPLRRLDATATTTWLSSVGFEGDPSEVHRICEGNPLFIEEAVRLGVDRFATAAAGGVAVVLAEHLARISTATKETLAIASVLGRDASRADIAALTGGTLDDVAAAAREGLVAGVLSSTGTTKKELAFAHVLLRDSLYEELPPLRRAALHVRAADQIEARGGPLSIVAEHLLAAGDGADAERVARVVCNAAEAEVRRHAADSAIELISSARTRLAERLAERTTLMFDLTEVDAIMRSRPSDEARARVAECAARAKRLGLAAEYARAALAYGRELLIGRVDRTMINLLEGALEVLPPSERALRALILARLAAAIAPPDSPEDLAKCVRYAREAIAVARELGHVPTLHDTLLWSFHALIYNVPMEEHLEVSSELVSLARDQGADLALASIGGYHAISLLESGRPVAARHEADAYCRHIESLPIPALHWKAHATRATMAAMDGRFDEAKNFADELRKAAGSSKLAAVATGLFEFAFGVCTRETERLVAVERETAKVLESVGPRMAPLRACFEALLGRNEAARAHLERARVVREMPGVVHLFSAQTAVLLGSAELAEEFYDQLVRTQPFGRFFWGPGSVFPIGPTSRLLGELALLRGDAERARAHFDTAIAECREMQAVPFLALSEEGRQRASGPLSRPSPSPSPSKSELNVELTREGDVWVVTSGTSAPFRVKHAKGIEYLDHLLRSPGREVYVLILGGAGEGPEDAGSILDDRAKLAYRQRVEELEDQLDEAERLGDRGRATRAREELEAVAEQLASAVGLGGRDRKAASNVHRARVNVQRRLKDAIRRIGEHDADLGRYLDATVRTGTYCVYRPV
jgi:tetratricopeptide (TPR) repeat protein